MDRSRLAVVIPALNEAGTIAGVIHQVSQYATAIVIDDGSRDETANIARNCGAIVHSHHTNLGYDAALNSGFKLADEIGCEFIITMDADGQHNPQLIPDFMGLLESGADLVVGHRDKVQRFAEHVFSQAANLLWKINDPLCGLKAYQITLYRELGHFDSYGSIGTELAIYAACHGKCIKNLPIITRDRRDQPRFGRTWYANKKIFRALFMALSRTNSNAMKR